MADFAPMDDTEDVAGRFSIYNNPDTEPPLTAGGTPEHCIDLTDDQPTTGRQSGSTCTNREPDETSLDPLDAHGAFSDPWDMDDGTSLDPLKDKNYSDPWDDEKNLGKMNDELTGASWTDLREKYSRNDGHSWGGDAEHRGKETIFSRPIFGYLSVPYNI